MDWALKDAGWFRDLGRGCVWSGKGLRSGEIGCAVGEALGALLQALLWFWGPRGMPGILPTIHILLKMPVR